MSATKFVPGGVIPAILLPFHDGLRHAQDGIETLAHVLDQPARLLQLRAQLRLAPGLLEHTGVHLVHAQARHHVGVQRDRPAALGAPHDHVRHHIV